MKWKKFTLTTTVEAEDLISSMLDEIGIQGIEIEDKVPLTEKETKGMFIDILPELGPDDGVARISFYVDEDEDTDEVTYYIFEEGRLDYYKYMNRWERFGRGLWNCPLLRTWEQERSRLQRRRIRTGLITGNSISSLLLWIIS